MLLRPFGHPSTHPSAAFTGCELQEDPCLDSEDMTTGRTDYRPCCPGADTQLAGKEET